MSGGDGSPGAVAQVATVQVIHADATRVASVTVPWRAGLTVAQALAEASSLVASVPDFEACGIGVFGERAAPGDVLLPGDRLEIVPPLPNDPKVSRRQRVLDAKAEARAAAEGGRQRGR